MEERPTKRTKLLSDDESSAASDPEDSGFPALKVNEEYARRFEHNSRRAELHRLEEKLGPDAARKALAGGGSESESSSEEEDEDGELAQGALDQQFQAVLTAIRNKDPKIYDPTTQFYSAIDEDAAGVSMGPKKEKAVYLKDYHREKLLDGHVEDADTEDGDAEPTYVQQQAELKRNVTRAMHDAAQPGLEEDVDDAEDGFLVAKPRAEQDSTAVPALSKDEIEHADQDPESFLNKFIESRAWVQTPAAHIHPFESDDDEEEARADAIEEAYNMRFEDPDKANEQLKTHARDAAAKLSTRKEKISQRQRARETERERNTAEKQQRSQDNARLRKLRLEEAEEKLERIREAAGVHAGDIDVGEMQEFLTEDWDDQRWEKEMQKRFGDKYYAAASDADSNDGEEGSHHKKPRKPKWSEDINIGDLVPDFESDEEKRFSLSEDEDVGANLDEQESKDKKEMLKRDKAEEKRTARKQKRLVEQLVDEKLGFDELMDGVHKSKAGAGFRYRETSPVNFGMTSRDILLASDSQLNQYAGLKKMSAFRDPEKKRKDHKRLGKKARLRQWRRETFGDPEGSKKTLQDVVREEIDGVGGDSRNEGNGLDIREGKRRHKRKRPAEV